MFTAGSRAWRWSLAAIALVVLAAWAQVLVRVSNPGRLFGGYHADSAIPVLMSNDDAWRIEALYYWGQDRFSGTPFAIAAAAHRLFDVFWAPSDLARWQALWVLLAAVVMWRWSRSPVPSLMLAALMLSSGWTPWLLDIAHPYGWQLTWLLMASLVLSARALGERRFAGLGGAGVLLLLTWQAHAANAMSGTWLLAAALGEVALGARRRWLVVRDAVIPVSLGFALEAAVRGVFQLRYKWTHGIPVHTNMGLGLSELPAAYAKMLGHFSLVEQLSLAVCLGLVVSVLWARRIPRWLVYPALYAVLNAVQPPLIRHIQLNDVEQRYFTLAGHLAPWVVVASVAWGLERRARWLSLPPLVLLLPLLPLWSPLPEADPSFADELAAAQALAARAPNSVLASGYWETFLLASLVERPALTPMPRAGQYQRSAHLFAELEVTEATVWVANRGTDRSPDPLESLALSEHVVLGRTLFLRTDETFVAAGRPFLRYQRAPLSKREHLKLCPDAPLTVDARGTVVLFGPETARYQSSWGEARREGWAWVWRGTGSVTVRSEACVDTWLYVLEAR